MSSWAIVVAAGTGSRFGGTKQFEMLGDRRVLDWSLDMLREVVDGVVVVVAEQHLERVRSSCSAEAVVGGGSTRSQSVRCGLSAVPLDASVVVVHDAARPLASAGLARAVIDAVRDGADAAVPGVPVVDTIKRVTAMFASDDRAQVLETVDRSELVAVQTPQAFDAAVLRAAHDREADASDDAGLVEAMGGSVVVVRGEVDNVKITVPRDLRIARASVTT